MVGDGTPPPLPAAYHRTYHRISCRGTPTLQGVPLHPFGSRRTPTGRTAHTIRLFRHGSAWNGGRFLLFENGFSGAPHFRINGARRRFVWAATPQLEIVSKYGGATMRFSDWLRRSGLRAGGVEKTAIWGPFMGRNPPSSVRATGVRFYPANRCDIFWRTS